MIRYVLCVCLEFLYLWTAFDREKLLILVWVKIGTVLVLYCWIEIIISKNNDIFLELQPIKVLIQYNKKNPSSNDLILLENKEYVRYIK